MVDVPEGERHKKATPGARPKGQDDGPPARHNNNTRQGTFFFHQTLEMQFTNRIGYVHRFGQRKKKKKKCRPDIDSLACWPCRAHAVSAPLCVVVSLLCVRHACTLFLVVHRTWALGGIAAGVASTAAVVLGAAWTSADPSFGNAVARAASKIAWPLVILAGGWRLSLLEALRPAGLLPSAVDGVGAQALHWTKGVVSFAATFVALYAVGGLTARALYSATCTPPRPSDAHAHEDVAFCQRSAEASSAVVWPFQAVAGYVRRVSASLDQTAQ